MFQAAIDNTSNQLKNQAAARGKLGSGGLVNALFNNYLSQGQNFLNNDFNRIFNVSQMGQNAAAGVGSNIQAGANNISNLLGQGANANAGRIVTGKH